MIKLFLLNTFFVQIISATTLSNGAIQFNEEDIVYTHAKKPFPPVMMAILEGNPLNKGIYTFRIKVQKETKVPLHVHLKDERVSVLKGEICIGFNAQSSTCIKEGGYYVNPKNVVHYLFTKENQTILQVTGEGPWQMNLIKGKNDGTISEN